MPSRAMLENLKIDNVLTASSTNTTTLTSATLDMLGYDGCILITTIGTTATASVNNYLQARQGNAANMSDAATLAGSKLASDGTKKAYVLEIVGSQKRYLDFQFVRPDSSNLQDMWAVRWRGTKPEINVTASQQVKSVINPVEGTP